MAQAVGEQVNKQQFDCPACGSKELAISFMHCALECPNRFVQMFRRSSVSSSNCDGNEYFDHIQSIETDYEDCALDAMGRVWVWDGDMWEQTGEQKLRRWVSE